MSRARSWKVISLARPRAHRPRAQNGKLYAAPHDADRVLEVDTESGAVRKIGEALGGLAKYSCLTAARNGKLYAALDDAAMVLELDLECGAVRQIGEAIEGDDKYLCLTAARNGKLYAAPYDAAPSVLGPSGAVV